ncbi:MAG: AbrB/MazE/SpoVT family DNA-binding domain-containing protein [Clostridiales bacterium]|nr:AbrB/MazE/SpoVT family DNA-binding domain-containing protein [Clostridiales bacterium]
MHNLTTNNESIDRKIIRVSGKRQITIPQKYFEKLDLNDEVECVLEENAIIIRNIPKTTMYDFSENILSDLIEQGFTGKELLFKFKEVSKKIEPALDKMIKEADILAKSKDAVVTMSDIFDMEN